MGVISIFGSNLHPTGLVIQIIKEMVLEGYMNTGISTKIQDRLTGPLEPVFASPKDIWNSTRLRSSVKASFMENRIISITSSASRPVASSRSSQRARACGWYREGEGFIY